MLREFKLYDIRHITNYESEYFYEGVLPDGLYNLNYYNVLFIKRYETNTYSVFTVEQNVPIYHGHLVSEALGILFNEESHNRTKSFCDPLLLGVAINQCFGTGPSNARERFDEVQFKFNLRFF